MFSFPTEQTRAKSHSILFSLVTLVAVTSVTIEAKPAQAVTGTTSGTFDDLSLVDNANQPDFVNGKGTSSLTFGFTGQPTNLFQFTGANFNTEVDQPFIIGLLTYGNGIVFGLDSSRDYVYSSNLTVSVQSPDSAFNSRKLTEMLQLNATVNNHGDPIKDADIISFPNRPDIGKLVVLEGATNGQTQVELLGKFGSFDLVGFGKVVSGADTGFVVPGTPIPESSSVGSLILFGAFGAGFMLKRNLKKQ